MMQRASFICECERIALDSAVLHQLVETTGSDFRQVLNQLQIVSSLQEKGVSPTLETFTKDQLLSVTAFDATKLLLVTPQNTPLRQRYDAFFCDYELTPLFVQQNYLDAIKSNGASPMALEQMAEAADAMCDMEGIHECMVKNNVDFGHGCDG